LIILRFLKSGAVPVSLQWKHVCKSKRAYSDAMLHVSTGAFNNPLWAVTRQLS
jgi:hypothetical protein